MTGMIISGHANFATGFLSALNLLAGDVNAAAVDFTSGQSEDDLRENMKNALDSMSGCSRIFILCDLIGGSPFKCASALSIGREDVRVIYGINLGMAIELSMCDLDSAELDIDSLADSMKDTAIENVGVFRLPEASGAGPEDEGI
ncbi:MAG: PTS system fructose subfamily transporter subunit IIA [Bacillota bacterium]|nr:PTS system fructose subfamily transporter subunit IIA [Bacillota bacterium]